MVARRPRNFLRECRKADVGEDHRPDTEFRVESPRLLFEGTFFHDDTDPNVRYLDAASGDRFLIVEAVEGRGEASIVVAQHWDEELKRLLPDK